MSGLPVPQRCILRHADNAVREYFALIIGMSACRILIAVGVLAFVLLLATVGDPLRLALRGAPRKSETFLEPMAYYPCFIDPLAHHATCPGYTTGTMPSIEVDQEGGWLCPGMIGVPP